jgi:hypothetical protein
MFVARWQIDLPLQAQANRNRSSAPLVPVRGFRSRGQEAVSAELNEGEC